jgi:hypothetical protein
VKTAGHKRLVLASCGCGTVLLAGMAVAVVFGLREVNRGGLGSEFTRDIWYTPSHARAALDSLAELDFALVDLPSPHDLQRRTRAGNGALAAIALWQDSLYTRINIPLGDSLPKDSQRRANWLATAEWTAVDTLLDAARLPWRLTGGALPGPDSTGRLMRAMLDPRPVLWTTRATLARAEVVSKRSPALADTLTFAVITIGRRLQEDALLPHVLLGLRIERDALEMLNRRRLDAGRDTEALEEAEIVLRQAARVIRHAGSLAENAPELARLARDPDLPLAIRSETAIAIGYGWALSPAEGAVINPLRRSALESIATRDTAGFGVVLRAARGAVSTGFARRLILSSEYQSYVNDVQYGRFSRPR